MATTLSPLDVFREASLRSGLLTALQWHEVLRSLNLSTEPVSREESSDAAERMALDLIKKGWLTAYQSQQLRAGRTKLNLGPYRITQWLGQGGMGQVFEGVHEIMGRRCAIKVLPLSKANDLSRESFAREIRVQASLDSPYLVRAFDAGRDGSVHYLVTEFVNGCDLRKLVRSQGRLSMQQAASIIAQAAAGLEYAHQLGLIHRDVKPANILVTQEGHAKVSDVGLAAWIHGQDDDPRAGKIVGTADFLSPEQIRTPQKVGPPADIYSLGCTLYFAVTGHLPFPGGDTRDKCRRQLLESPWHPRKHAPELSDAFVETIADMMEKDSAVRIQSAAEVVQRLAPWAAATMPVIETPPDLVVQGIAAEVIAEHSLTGETLLGAEDHEFWLGELGLAPESQADPFSQAGRKSSWAAGEIPAIVSSGDDPHSQLSHEETALSSQTLSDIHRSLAPLPGDGGSVVGSHTIATPAPPLPPPINEAWLDHRNSDTTGKVSWLTALIWVIVATILSGISGGLVGWWIHDR